jgi:1-acyl-sn-glycerol-3-phosphate acyltransferase
MPPKYRFTRNALSWRVAGRILLPIIARVDIEGLERFPRNGPLIVVGNHTGALEVELLTVYAPRIAEYLVSIDIPHVGYITTFINLYDFIPVARGNASRASLEAVLEVLRQDAVLGLFPRGRNLGAGHPQSAERGRLAKLPGGGADHPNRIRFDTWGAGQNAAFETARVHDARR